jgi:hypothetical protein
MMASLFISYSRINEDFARKLTKAFEDQGMDVWIDLESIPLSVDWWQEIEKGIEEADAFLFLLSPDSAKSEVCKREIDHAIKNGKRLIPIVVHDVKAGEAPAELRSLNWLFFLDEDKFSETFDRLLITIKTDYEWVQFHRQLQVKALEWKRSEHENSFLLRGKELRDAEFQLEANSTKEPYPTNLQYEYISTSRKAKVRQQRITGSISVIVFIIIIWLAYEPVKDFLTTPEMPDWAPKGFYQGDTPRVIAMNLRNPDEVYVSGQSTEVFYRSTNGGEDWHRITQLEVNIEIIGLAAVKDKLYVLTNQSIWLTQNKGKTWSVVKSPVLDTKTKFLSISINPQNEDEIYVGSNNGTIYHTKDIGEAWDIVQPGYKGKSIKAIATNGFAIILADEEGLWVHNIENEGWIEISLTGCSERSDEVNALAFTYPYSGYADDGAYGFVAAVPGTGVCDSDTKNLHGNTLLIPHNAEISSLTIADQADLFAYEGYIALSNGLLRKRIWRSSNIEWWKIKIESFFN